MSELNQGADYQEIWVAGSQDPYVRRVQAKLYDRSRVGLIKYGTGLHREDLSTLDWLQHCQDEMMDAANYLERIMENLKEEQG